MNGLTSSSRRFGRTFLIAAAALLLSFFAAQAVARTVSPFPEPILGRFAGQSGKVLYFTVTGSTSSGQVWGSNPYADGSSLARAAVHAGVLGVGQKGVVKVTTTTGTSYPGSSANGVTTTDYNAPYGGFSVAADDGGDNPPIPDPGTIADFRSVAPGSVYLFAVTGSDSCCLWGTNTYTYDSRVATAAVQAGVLALGQSGTVRVVVTSGLKDYAAGTHNGVTSAAWGVASGVYESSFTVSNTAGSSTVFPYPGMQGNPLPDPGNMGAFIERIGAALHFRVTGSISGGLWGTGTYTWDSYFAPAVVHAGLAGAGQSVVIKATVMPGQSSYTGSSANGVTSQSWGSYNGSFTVATPDGAMGTIPMITSPLGASGSEGQAFAYTIAATQSPVEFYASGLPEGLTVNNADGQISGVPKVGGSFHVELLARNASGTSNADLVLNIAASGGTTSTTSSTTTSTSATTTSTTGSTTTTTLVNQPLFGANLIFNGDAEHGAGSTDGSVVTIPGWTVSGLMTAVKYENSAGFPTLADPGPANRGMNFFAGGPDGAVATISQVIDISAAGADIDAGRATYFLSGFFGGWSSQGDNAVLSVDFRNASGEAAGSASVGPVTSTERNNATGLLFREALGSVPSGTRTVEVKLQSNRAEGSFNDGYADSLALVLTMGGGSGSTTTSTSTTSTSATSTSTTSTSATTTTTGSTTTTTQSGGGITLNLFAGWNLVGNSGSTAIDVTSLFGDPAKVTTVWKWVAAKLAWAFYTPTLADGGAAYAASKGYDPLTAVNSGEGYWVNARTNFSVQWSPPSLVSSVMFQTQLDGTSALVTGWNLIAVGDSPTPSTFNKSIGQTTPAAGEIPTNLTTLWAWDAAQSNWYFYAPSLEKSGGLTSYIASKAYLDFGTRVLDPTTGFWVNKPAVVP